VIVFEDHHSLFIKSKYMINFDSEADNTFILHYQVQLILFCKINIFEILMESKIVLFQISLNFYGIKGF
jgi:hypothetical protein